MKYNVKVVREFTTWIEVEAQSTEQALYLASYDNPTREKLYSAELEQCNVEDKLITAEPNGTLWARKCDATGQGMNEGFVFGDGEKYFSVQSAAIEYAQELGYKDLDEAYDDEAYYWTEWEDKSEYQYLEVDGKLIEIQ